MKKISKSLLALCLCLVLVMTAVVPAFAATGTVKTLKVSAATVNSITLVWSKVAGATSYQLQQYVSRQWKTIATTKSRTYTVGNLALNAVCIFRVRANGKAGYGAFSPSVKASPAAVPAIKATKLTATTATLSWNAVTGMTGYRVQQYKNKTWITVVKATKKTAVTVKTLLPGSNNRLRILAYTKQNGKTVFGNASPLFTVKTPMVAAPTALKATKAVSTAVALTWAPVAGAESYIVYRVNGNTQKAVAKPTGTKATIKNLGVATDYIFAVRTVMRVDGDRYYSPFSANLSVRTAPAKVKNVKTQEAGDTSLTLQWTAAKNAEGYRLRIKGGSFANWTYVGTTDKTVYTIENLTKATTYQIQVRAYHTINGGATYGVYSAVLNAKTSLNGASGFAVTGATVDSVSLTWAQLPDATSYTLEQSTDGKTFKAADAMQAQNGDWYIATVYGLAANTTYTFRLTPKTNGENGVPSLVSGATAPGQVTGLTAAQISGGVKLSWKKTAGAGGYEIASYDAAKGWVSIGTTTNTTYVVEGLPSSRDYVFRVTAYYLLDGSKQFGTPSASVSTKVLPAAVQSLAATKVDTTSFIAHWAPNAAATGYKLYLSEAQGSYCALSVTPTLSGGYMTATIGGLANGTEYALNVCAVVDGMESLPATLNVKTVAARVTGLTAAATDEGNISLSWDAVKGAERYEIQQSTSASSGFATVASVVAMPYTVTGLSAGTTYYFRVCAVNTSSGLTQKGTFSATASAKTKTAPAQVIAAPTNLKATDASSGNNYRMSLTWTTVTGATGYEVSAKSGTTWSVLNTTTGNTYTATGLTADTLYAFRVRAYKDSTGSRVYSDYSAAASARTAAAPVTETVPAPTGVKASDTSSNSTYSILVSWNTVSGATSYKVYMSTGATWSLAGTVYSNAYTAYNLAANTTYYFRVRAVKNNIESADSATVSAKTPVSSTPVTTLAAPTGVQAIDSSNGSSFSVTVSWNGVTNAEKYEVSQKNGSAWTVLRTTTGTSYTVTGLSAATTYTFRVRAVNGSTYSAYSAEASATTGSGSSSEHQTSSTKLSNLAVKMNADGISYTVSWKDVSNAIYAIDIWNASTNKWVSTGATQYNSQITLKAENKDFNLKNAAGSDNTTSLTWNSVSGASGYEVRSEVYLGSGTWMSPVKASGTSISLRLPPNANQTARVTALGTFKIRIYALDTYNESRTLAYSEYSNTSYLAYQDLSFKTPAVGTLSSSSAASLKEAYTLMLLQAVNNTRYETGVVNVTAKSHMKVDPTDYDVKALLFFTIPDSFIKDVLDESRETQDVTSTCRYEYGSGRATIVDVSNGVTTNSTRSSLLQTAIVPNSGLSYLYDQHNLNSFNNGIQAVTATANADGSTTVKVTLKKESFDRNSSAKYHPGFTESFASSQSELADLGDYQASVGATTITAKINKNYTLDALDVISPFTISAKASESGITIKLVLEGTSDYHYTFTR